MDKILVVDDNTQNCEILADVLSAWGYDVYKAFQGMEAYNCALKFKPDVILLDVMLPGMNGFEVCKKLKNNPITQNIPVIMLTVLTDVEDRIRGFNVGAEIFLSKPINYNELKNRVDSLINNKKSLEKMEFQSKIVESFLELMQINNYPLYLHSVKVRDYCEKVARLLSIVDQELEHLLIGASLHDLGKLFSVNSKEHVFIGERIISPLIMSKWLKIYVRNHHEKMNGQGYPDGLTSCNMSLELQILLTINRFMELWEQLGDKDTGILKLTNEMKHGWWSNKVIEALKQVIEDEKFLECFNNN